MKKSSDYIHPLRRSVPTPDSLVDDTGRAAFGTFENEFPHFHLLSAKHPTHLPDLFNKYKLTLWQAAEIDLKEGILLCAVCDMGVFGKILQVFYDKTTHDVYTFDTTLSSRNTHIASHLTGGAVSEAKTQTAQIQFTNLLDRGSVRIRGKSCRKNDTLEFDFRMKRISKPSVVSIPLGSNRPLYTQKDFFKAEGSLTINGKTYASDKNTFGILDDHRGYYPRKMHYDWVTGMGILPETGPFAFNLTRNQSLDQEKYNENLIWLQENSSLLPPVSFQRNPVSRKFKKESLWQVRDEYDKVHVDFL